MYYRGNTWVCVGVSGLLSSRDAPGGVTSFRLWQSLSYGHNYVFCGLTWGHISGAKIGRFQLLLSKNAVYTRFIPSPRPRFWDVVSRQLIEQGSSHRVHRWRVFQVLKLVIVRWDRFFRKDGLVSALFLEIDAFCLEGLESLNPPTFFVFASLGCTFCSPID